MSTFVAIVIVVVFVGFVFLMTPRPPRHRSTAPLRRVEPPVSTRIFPAPPASVPPQFPMPPTAIQTAYAAFELGNHPPVQETVIPSPGAEFLDRRWEWKFDDSSIHGAVWIKVRCLHLEYAPVENDGVTVSLLCTTCGERIRVEN